MPKRIVGIVSSDVQDKTIVVTVTSRETHPLYRKQYTINRKYTAHDEANTAHKGDKVELEECRPYSKNKVWKLVSVLETGHADVELKQEEGVEEALGVEKSEEAVT